mgnify:CR=1 FL=1
MKNWIRTTAVIAATGTLAFGAVGCGKKSTESATSSTTSTSTSAVPVNKQTTIQDYIKESKITEVAISPTDQGVPIIGLPFPPGWVSAGANTPPWSFGAILFAQPKDPNNPPNVIAAMSKLTGNVDPAKILDYAPNEMRNMGSFAPIGEPSRVKVGGYDAVQAGGTYIKNDIKRAIIQTTVVIPAKDAGVFVLQMNADAPADQEPVLADAVKALNSETKITV